MSPDPGRLDHLRLVAASLRARLLGVTEEAGEVRRERDSLALEIDRIEALNRHHPGQPIDLAGERRELAGLAHRVAGLDAEAADLTERWKTAAQLVERCQRYLAVRAREAA